MGFLDSLLGSLGSGLASSGISTGIGLLSSGLDSLFGTSDSKNRKALEMQKEFAKYQSDLSLNNSKELTSFNNQESLNLNKQMPSAQVQGMINAGINPALMNGTPSTAASSIGNQSASSGTLSFNPIDTMLRARELDIQDKLATAQANKLESETKGQDIDNKWKDVINDAEVRYKDSVGLKTLQDRMESIERTYGQKIANSIANDLQLDKILQGHYEALLTQVNYELSELEKKFADKTYDERVELITQELAKLKEEINLTLEKESTEKTQQTLNKEETKTQKTQQSLNRANASYLYVKGANETQQTQINRIYAKMKAQEIRLQASGKIVEAKKLRLEREKFEKYCREKYIDKALEFGQSWLMGLRSVGNSIVSHME